MSFGIVLLVCIVIMFVIFVEELDIEKVCRRVLIWKKVVGLFFFVLFVVVGYDFLLEIFVIFKDFGVFCFDVSK